MSYNHIMKVRELIRKLRRPGVEIVRGRGKGGHVPARYQGRQATIAVPFVKEICKQLGIDPKDAL
jgi:mRNA interferase HicA